MTAHTHIIHIQMDIVYTDSLHAGLRELNKRLCLYAPHSHLIHTAWDFNEHDDDLPPLIGIEGLVYVGKDLRLTKPDLKRVSIDCRTLIEEIFPDQFATIFVNPVDSETGCL